MENALSLSLRVSPQDEKPVLNLRRSQTRIQIHIQTGFAFYISLQSAVQSNALGPQLLVQSWIYSKADNCGDRLQLVTPESFVEKDALHLRIHARYVLLERVVSVRNSECQTGRSFPGPLIRRIRQLGLTSPF